jgi:dimethylglycine dehydrogenase
VVAEEVAAVQNAVGLAEVNGFNRIEITGADRHAFLDRMCCGAVPKRDGRVGLGYLLNAQGMVKAEATFANLPASDRGPARLWYGSAAAAERHDMDWLVAHRHPGEDVQFRSLTENHAILLLAGPKSRAVLSQVARGDWTAKAFPWLSVRECFVDIAPATVMAVSYSGELAYEIHVPLPSLYAAYSALREAGKAHGLRLFGSHAVESMRLEKSFLHWKSDLLTEFDPFETGLDRFVRMDKDFLGKAALVRRQENGPRKRLVTLKVDADDRPARPGASMMIGDRVIGTVTSGAWGHRTGLNLALGFVDPQQAAPGSTLTLDLLGDAIAAEVIPPSPYDPDMTRPRM